MDRAEIMAVLAGAGQGPQHRFGQNFMVDQNVLRAIADAGEIGERDVVLEVGPGVGNLTRLLSERASKGAVVAVDIDKKLMGAAMRHHAGLTNVEWVSGDVLAGKHAINAEVVAKLKEVRGRFAGGELKLVSNLPYNAASPLVAELLVLQWQERGEFPLKRMAFTVQWEVGERMRAKVGTRDYGPLGVLIQLLADVEVVRKIAPGAFWPAPKIHSALVVVVPREERFGAVKDVVGLQRMLAGLFGHRRQKLSNAIKHYLGERADEGLMEKVRAAGIDVGLRPEGIRPEEFLKLSEIVGSLEV